MKMGMMVGCLLAITQICAADDLQQRYEKAYYLETAKGQTEEALEIYREIASTPSGKPPRRSTAT